LFEEKRMYNVGNNLLAPPLSGLAPGTLPGVGAMGASGFGPAALADAINPSLQPPASADGSPYASLGSGNGPGGFIAAFMSTFFGALSQMAQYFTSMSGQPPWSQGGWPTQPSPVNGGGAPGQPPVGGGGAPGQPSVNGGSAPGQPPVGGGGAPGQGQEQFFTSADVSSNGDPHDSFHGTTSDGQSIGAHWGNMMNHPHLLESNSFAGGFEVSTDVTSQNAHGITRNDAATIESDYGRNVVTMNADGSYSVSENGKAVGLKVGQSVDLGHGETVTLNADNSLTVVEKNQSGGEISTTLHSNGSAVNVDATAQNVDLGGYLERHATRTGAPGTPTPGSSDPQAAAAGSASAVSTPYGTILPAFGASLPSQTYQQYQPFQASEPFGAAQSSTPDIAQQLETFATA
jgi:hypothetical protein